MVMDDLFVNFDEGRTNAAVDALIEFADSGQQVLFFTCHRHLAMTFEERGVQSVWLPGPAGAEIDGQDRDAFDEQVAERLFSDEEDAALEAELGGGLLEREVPERRAG